MASVGNETVHKQAFSIYDLATRSVTLYPTRAAIVRDIESVTIQPGRNEITILGLTPLADENSIKVEGHGTDALITDTVVDRRRNTRYDDPSDSDSDESEEEPEYPDLENLKDEIDTIQQEIEDAEENVRSASNQLTYLEQHTFNLCIPGKETGSTPVTNTKAMAENLETYNLHREKIYLKHKKAQSTLKTLRQDIFEKQNQISKLQKAHMKSQRKAKKLTKEKEQERLEKKEQKVDRPQWVQRIRITIESNSVLAETPSITSTISTGRPARKDDDEPPAKSQEPSLRISYITTGAYWTPRYDLRLDTTSRTGVLTYRAQFINRTGELWRDANITLSTSQTSFGGLEDKVPFLDSWRITLRKRDAHGAGKDECLYSQVEKEAKEARKGRLQGARRVGYPPFGQNVTQLKGGSLFGAPQQQQQASGGFFRGAQAAAPILPPQTAFGQFPQAQSLSLFGNTNSAPNFPVQELPQSWANYGSETQPVERERASGPEPYGGDTQDPDSDSDSDSDSATLNKPLKMGLASSTSSSYGLTTTYDLSGTRTVSSSPLFRRHVIAEYTLPDIEFSHIAVPKLRAAAFLKAKIRNPASTPLLRGPVGLTLDGSFLGNGVVPRCAPGDTFELGLGVDEEVLVGYRKPVKRMASQGMLVKEQVATYERGVRVYNARGNAVKLVLFDQIPVSEDERLKIVILKPKGLRNIGDVVKTSTGAGSAAASARSGISGGVQSGEIVAELRKGGEIRYEMNLEKGKEAVLPLEYEARLPTGEAMFGLNN